MSVFVSPIVLARQSDKHTRLRIVFSTNPPVLPLHVMPPHRWKLYMQASSKVDKNEIFSTKINSPI